MGSKQFTQKQKLKIFFNFKKYLLSIYNQQNYGSNRQGAVRITTQLEKY